MIIDVHAHFLPPAAAAVVRDLDAPPRPAVLKQPIRVTWEERLEHMAAAGVGRQVLSAAGDYYYEDVAPCAQVARLVNDGFADIRAADPDRFSFWATLPLPHVEQSLDELDRAFDRGAVGVVIGTFIRGGSIARPEFDPIWAELDRRAAVVFLHPVQNALGSPLFADWGLTVACGASMEDSLAALHLIAAGIPRRFPRIRFIVPHFGGILPMLLDRLDGQMPRAADAEPPSTTARRFFYDTVGWGSRPALHACVGAFGAGQIVPGSDYPVLLTWESYSRSFDHIRDGGLSPEDVDLILARNAQALLKL